MELVELNFLPVNANCGDDIQSHCQRAPSILK